jgi:hypothetical protein
MTVYRATRNEPRVGVGSWTGDFRRGELYEGVEAESFNENGEPVYPRKPNTVPEYIGVYLCSHGVLVDARVEERPAETPMPPSPTPPVSIVALNGANDE